MATQWLGRCVSVDCGEVLGIFQGQVLSVNAEEQTVTLGHAFRNGVPYRPSVAIRAADIKHLQFVNLAEKMADTSNSYDVSTTATTQNKASQDNQSKKGIDSPAKASTKIQRLRSNSFSDADRTASHAGKKQDCFAVPVHSFIGEFDFEENLALFNKEQVYNEIENGAWPLPDSGAEKIEKKYRHDEMILPKVSTVLRQIAVAQADCGGRDYVTDNGLVVPSVTLDVRSKVFAAAEKAGLSTQRLVDMLGRSASEMVLQLIGGSHRLNPKNDHQKPKVVLFCGPHLQGASGVNCARHLANHGVDVVLLTSPLGKPVIDILSSELDLFALTKGARLADAKSLPSTPVDMIVNCMDSHDPQHQWYVTEQPWYRATAQWSNENKANVLTVDPPASGSAINAKWNLGYILPLSLTDKLGQLYLCDLGIPDTIFDEAGIRYLSPFGPKFYIPLHNT